MPLDSSKYSASIFSDTTGLLTRCFIISSVTMNREYNPPRRAMFHIITSKSLPVYSRPRPRFFSSAYARGTSLDLYTPTILKVYAPIFKTILFVSVYRISFIVRISSMVSSLPSSSVTASDEPSVRSASKRTAARLSRLPQQASALPRQLF